MRKRYLSPSFTKLIAFSPLVGVLGHRQVGKTTFIQTFASDYLSFDDEETLLEAQKSAKNFLTNHSKNRTVIDESQLLPSLFPALKERVRISKKPGQYILSGSVRFTSRKAIRESLTGRIMNLELLPFTIGEIQHEPLSQSILQFCEANNLDNWALHNMPFIKHSLNLQKEIPDYLNKGGLPGVCFIRNDSMRNIRIAEQLNMILDRDLRLVYPTTLPLSQILDFVRILSELEGAHFKHSYIEKKVKISEATQKKLFYALESIFIIRRFTIEGGQKGMIHYFEDQAESSYLANYKKDYKIEREGLLFRHIRAQLAYQLGQRYRFYHYLTRAGTRIPFVIETPQCHLAIIPMAYDEPTKSETSAINSFYRNYPNAKAILVNFEASTKNLFKAIDSRTVVLPAGVFL